MNWEIFLKTSALLLHGLEMETKIQLKFICIHFSIWFPVAFILFCLLLLLFSGTKKNNKTVFEFFFRDYWNLSTYVFAIVLYYSSVFHLIPLSFTVFFPNVFVLWFLILLTAMYVVDCMWCDFHIEAPLIRNCAPLTTHHRCFCTWLTITVYCYLRHRFVEKRSNHCNTHGGFQLV